jgi:hypothetical protein
MRPLRIAICFLVLFGVGAGCTSSNPAAPPAPPAEVPALLRLPQTLSINVDTVRPASGSPGLAAEVASGGEFSEAISGAAEFTSEIESTIDDFISRLDGLFETLEVPVSPSVDTFKKTVAVDADCRIDPAGTGSVSVQIDFRDFDADQSGAPDGCTGCTCPLGCASDGLTACEGPEANLRPVCFRLWTEWTGVSCPDIPDGLFRLASGRFDRLAVPASGGNAGNAGRGRIVQDLSGDEFAFLGVGVIYDHLDPLDKSSEIFLRSDPVPSGAEGTIFDNTHIAIRQKGPDATAFKSLRVSVEGRFPDLSNSAGNGDLKYIGQWLEGNNFWSGSVEDTRHFSGTVPSFENACALIATGEGAPRQNCIDLGIDAEGVEFVDFATLLDVTFPPDFTETPTF